VRKQARTLLVAFILATLATVLVAAPAFASEVKGQTHKASVFGTGHAGYVKIALEKDASSHARAHVGVWCENSSGSKIQCGAIEFNGHLDVQHWDETNGWTPDIAKGLDYVNTDPPTTLNEYTSWGCTSEGTDQYRAIIYQVRIQDTDGTWGSWHDFTHSSWLGSYC
jgi:hypothetical protein